jgi:hypothetical protein
VLTLDRCVALVGMLVLALLPAMLMHLVLEF